MKRRLWYFVLSVFTATALSSCGGSLSPLYRDFRAPDIEDSELLDQIGDAVVEAGWVVGTPAAPNVVTTEYKTLRRWGLYRIDMHLDVIPIGSNYVRVIFHPYRRFFTGGRSKVLYLSPGIRRSVLPEIVASLESRGLRMVGTPIERDRDRTRENIR